MNLQGEESIYEDPSIFQCLKCAEGCESCEDSSPCIVTLNWVLRTILLILQCVIIGCLPVVVLFTYKYKDIKVRIFIKLKWVSHIFENIFLFSNFFFEKVQLCVLLCIKTMNITACIAKSKPDIGIFFPMPF